MHSNVIRGACALLLPLAMAATALAQEKTRTVLVGNTECQALNVAHARAQAATTPLADLNLWADGTFLGYRGRFYGVDAHAAGSKGGGFGSVALRVGGNAIQIGVAVPLLPRCSRSLQQSLLPANTSKQYWVGGLPVLVSGNITIKESLDLQFRLNANAAAPAVIEGTMSGEATGSVSAQLAVPITGYAAKVYSQAFRFGKQDFNGKVEAYTTTTSSALGYTLSPVSLVLILSTTSVFGNSWALWPVIASHPGMSLVSFM